MKTLAPFTISWAIRLGVRSKAEMAAKNANLRVVAFEYLFILLPTKIQGQNRRSQLGSETLVPNLHSAVNANKIQTLTSFQEYKANLIQNTRKWSKADSRNK